jgi:hypothetical protein
MSDTLRPLLLSLLVVLGCSSDPAAAPHDDDEEELPPVVEVPAGTRPPLNELGRNTYLGFSGGLYPDGSNTMPAAHAADGAAFARSIRPLDLQGNPSASGKIVILSIGMSNTTQEFCGGTPTACATASFVGRVRSDARVNPAVIAADGARGGQTAGTWDDLSDPNYETVRTQVLPALGVSEAQVQAVWLKVANSTPTRSLPDSSADALTLVRQMGAIARTLRARYPNLKQVFVSSRIYAG